MRINEFPYPKISMGFLEIYVSMTTLKGETFAIESSNVHTIITKFISGKMNPSKDYMQSCHKPMDT